MGVEAVALVPGAPLVGFCGRLNPENEFCLLAAASTLPPFPPAPEAPVPEALPNNPVPLELGAGIAPNNPDPLALVAGVLPNRPPPPEEDAGGFADEPNNPPDGG